MTNNKNTHESAGAASTTPPSLNKLVFRIDELCELLGGCHRTTIYKLEARGLLRSVPGLTRNKIFTAKEVERFLAGGRAEKAIGRN